MSKYVNTDMIVDRVCEGISCNECSFGTNEDGMSECVLEKRIAELPTADVVEVVYCEDCKHKEYCSQNIAKFGKGYDMYEAIHYCSYGERTKR